MGPTLFLAPSPTAWQARHLLNEALPAAASCAGAAADDAITASALKVSRFIVGSSSRWLSRGALWHGAFALDKPGNACRGSALPGCWYSRLHHPLATYPKPPRRA